MSDTPIAHQIAAELGMAWPLSDPDELHNPIHAPEVDQARLDAWRVTAARPPMHMAGDLTAWFTDSGDEGPPDGAAPVPDPDAGAAPPTPPAPSMPPP